MKTTKKALETPERASNAFVRPGLRKISIASAEGGVNGRNVISSFEKCINRIQFLHFPQTFGLIEFPVKLKERPLDRVAAPPYNHAMHSKGAVEAISSTALFM